MEAASSLFKTTVKLLIDVYSQIKLFWAIVAISLDQPPLIWDLHTDPDRSHE